MSFLSNIFTSKPSAPARVPTDTVIPVHWNDDVQTFRSVCLDQSMRFDDVLDVDKLIGALKRLLERPGWKKLGARLRLNTEGKLEYHVPIEFTEERPAMNFTRVSHNTSIAAHAEGSQLLRPKGSLEIGPDLSTFRSLLFPPKEKRCTVLADWIYTDRPQLQLHIVSFTDATLVTLTWLHTLLDAMAKDALLRGWVAMLEGRESDIPESYGSDYDPLASFGDPPESGKEEGGEEEEYVLKDKRLTGWKMFVFVVNYVWELVVYRQEHLRMVCIPPSFFKPLKQSAIDDLKAMHPATIVMDTLDTQNPKPFLSDGDVLCAWWSRLFMSCQPWATSAKPTKTIQIMNIFSFRELLASTEPKLLPHPNEGAYLANAVTPIISLFNWAEFLALPLGMVAARLRMDIVTQTTRPQINAAYRLIKESIKKTGNPPLYGDSDMMFTAFSNWSKGRMFDTDFSAAVIEESSVEHIRGKPTYCQADGTAKGFSVRNSGPCMGIDWQGNYWIGSCLRTKTWENVIKAVEGMK